VHSSCNQKHSKQTLSPPSPPLHPQMMLDYLMDVFTQYVEHGETQSSVSSTLQREAGPRSMRDAWQKENFPKDFKSMLSALEQFGVDMEQYTYDYDMCPGPSKQKPCGLLYRCVAAAHASWGWADQSWWL